MISPVEEAKRLVGVLRRFRVTISIAPLLVAVWLVVGGRMLAASDYFLTIGGGYNPSGNQASLERSNCPAGS